MVVMTIWLLAFEVTLVSSLYTILNLKLMVADHGGVTEDRVK